MDAAPSLRGDCAVHLRYDSWNLCVRSFGGPSPESPLRGGGVLGNRLEGPPHRELQWILGLCLISPSRLHWPGLAVHCKSGGGGGLFFRVGRKDKHSSDPQS